MTYYEELGISETASQEEIRQVCEHFAAVAGVLLDPVGRERYDRSLHALALAVAHPPPPVAPISEDWRRLAPAGIVVAAALLMLVLGASPVRAPLPLFIPQKPVVQMTVQPARTTGPPAEEEWEPLVTDGYDSHLAFPGRTPEK